MNIEGGNIWSGTGGGYRRSGLGAYDKNGECELKWRYTVVNESSFSISPVVIDKYENFYFCHEDKLYSISNEGHTKWILKLNSTSENSPAIDAQGNIYVAATSGEIYSFNNDGTKNWVIDIGNSVETSPIVGPNGDILVSKTSNTLYSIDPSGKIDWMFSAGSDKRNAGSAVDPDGNIYYPSWSKIFGISENGEPLWNITFEESYSVFNGPTGPVVTQDNDVLVSVSDGIKSKLICVSKDGMIKWNFTIDYQLGFLRPAISGSGNIYVAPFLGEILYSLDSKGSLIWKKQTSQVDNNIAVDKNERIYAPTSHYFNSISKSSEFVWSKKVETPHKHILGPPSIGRSGIVVTLTKHDEKDEVLYFGKKANDSPGVVHPVFLTMLVSIAVVYELKKEKHQ